MDLTPYLQRLRDDLLAAASLGDEHTRRAAALLTTTLEPAARLAMMAALSDLAAEVTGALQDTTVDIRLDGTQLRVSVDRHDNADNGDDWTAETPRADTIGDDDSDLGADLGGDLSGEDLGQAVRNASEELSRTTLRLVQNLKAQAEQAANAQGVSLNTYIQRAVSDAVRQAGGRARHHGGRRGPHTVSGFVQG